MTEKQYAFRSPIPGNICHPDLFEISVYGMSLTSAFFLANQCHKLVLRQWFFGQVEEQLLRVFHDYDIKPQVISLGLFKFCFLSG